MLDLSKKQKKFFVVKLTNGTTLSIPSPKKRIFERMTAMNDISLDTVSAENINEIYELIAEILSSNTQKKKYTADEVGEMLDFEDINMFLDGYMTFAGYITNDPN